MRQQMQNQQQMQMPYVVHPHVNPNNQPIQMGRPYCPQATAPQRPLPRSASQERSSQPIRGRPHDSFLRQPHNPPQSQSIEAQIQFHERELMKLR